MPTIDDILKIATPADFDRTAMAVFRRQATVCGPYRDYLDAVGIDPCEVKEVDEIPFLPIEIFKSHRVYCGSDEPEMVFVSSGTGGEGASRHYVASVADYERVYTRAFDIFYGLPWGFGSGKPASAGRVEDIAIFALLPSYLERDGSSLVRMADGLIARGRAAGRAGGFYLRDHAQLLTDMYADPGPKILLGVSYALLDLAEEMSARGEELPPGTIVMETGGMKGRRVEMPKARMHDILQRAFGVSQIHSEYGMAELMSQAYSSGGGRFVAPPWMRILVRDLVDPFDVRREGRGAIDIIDLGNLHSCAFIATQDIGRVAADGSFTIDGRVARSDIRGCNLLVE